MPATQGKVGAKRVGPVGVGIPPLRRDGAAALLFKQERAGRFTRAAVKGMALPPLAGRQGAGAALALEEKRGSQGAIA